VITYERAAVGLWVDEGNGVGGGVGVCMRGGGVLFGHATDAAVAPGLGGIMIPTGGLNFRRRCCGGTSGARDHAINSSIDD